MWFELRLNDVFIAGILLQKLSYRFSVFFAGLTFKAWNLLEISRFCKVSVSILILLLQKFLGLIASSVSYIGLVAP